MKLIFNTLLLFIAISFSNCSKETIEINTAKQPEGLGVLKQKIIVANANSNDAQAITNYEYFSNGKLKKTSYLHTDGKVLSYSKYKYNIKNQLKKIIDYTANSNYSNGYLHIATHEFEYLTNRLISKETIKYPVIGTSEHITFEYNSKGNLTKKAFFNSDNELLRYIIFVYDEFGNILKETSFSDKDEQTGETLHYYQNNMLYKSDIYILGNDKVHLEQILKTYDNNNNLIMLQSNILWKASSRSSMVLKFIYE